MSLAQPVAADSPVGSAMWNHGFRPVAPARRGRRVARNRRLAWPCAALAFLGLATAVRADADQVELAGQWGGPTDAVAVQGQVAYIGSGARLLTIDISDPNQPTLLGQSDVLPGVILGVAVVGPYAYVAAYDAGLQIIDVSTPAAPHRVGGYDTTGYAYAVAVAGSYAYVADYGSGLQIIDISIPATPQRVGGYDTSGSANGVAVVGSLAYVADYGAGLQIIDVSNPTAPQRIGGYDTNGQALGVALAGAYAYVADNGGGLQVLDISNPAAPQRVGGCDVTWAQDVVIAGTHAYVAAYGAGLQIVDVSNPAAPLVVGGHYTTGFAVGLVLTGSCAFVADDSAGLQIIDVSDPALPQRLGGYETSGVALGAALMGSYAYIAASYSGLQVIDISNPGAPQRAGRCDTSGEATGVAVAGSYAYVADAWTGLQIIDVSVPEMPVRVGGYDTSGTAHAVAVAGSYAYVADETAGLQVIDVSNPTTPLRVGGYDTSGVAYGVAVAGSYAYVADGDAGLQIIDVSNPMAPQWVGAYNTLGLAFDVKVVGAYAYVADRNAALQIINVANPAAPQRVAGCATGGNVYGVAVLGPYVYAADEYDLQIIDVSDPNAPHSVCGHVTSGYAVGVAVAGLYAYVADHWGGLVIVHLAFLDCNHNGVPDADDIAHGTSNDCNANGVPDECETDCNSNSVPDECDIASGTSEDCNSNAVPDECEVDCNENSIPDQCDIVAGTSQDCNRNGVPDECDIANGTSRDCVTAVGQSGMSDGVPDECEPDPNGLVYSHWDDGVGSWSDLNNWCPLLALSPNNTGPYTFDVTIADPNSIVTLDTSPTITAMSIQNGATVEVNAGSGASVRALIVLDPNGVVSAGTLRATGSGNRFVLDVPRVTQTAGGVLQADSGGVLQVNGARVEGGVSRTLECGSGSAIQLIGGAEFHNVTIESDCRGSSEAVVVPDAQSGVLRGTIVNHGGLRVDALLDITLLAPGSGGVTLSGTGSVVLADENLAWFGGFRQPITNSAGHHIVGAGILFGSLTNDPNAVIEANRAGKGLQLSAPGLKINDGILRASNQGILAILDSVTGVGDLVADSGSIEIPSTDGAVDVVGGGMAVLNGGMVSVGLDTGLDFSGAVTVASRGVYQGIGTSSAVLLADSLAIEGDGVSEGGQMLLSGTMSVHVTGHTYVTADHPCQASRGCTPPILRFTANATMQGQSLSILGGGQTQLGDDASVTVGDLAIDTGGVLEGLVGSRAAVNATTVLLTNSDSNGGQMKLTGTMRAHVAGNMTIADTGCTGPGRGCTPPILRFEANSQLNVGGNLMLTGRPIVQVPTAGPTVTVSGDFQNMSVDPLAFDWVAGRLTLDGSNTQVFEVAGVDVGSDPDGWIDNFAIGQLEVTAGRYVRFVDMFDNDQSGQTPCGEALYVDTLTLRTGSTIELVDCRVYCRHLVDDGATIIRSGCGALVVSTGRKGDMNCDGVLSFADINPFVSALAGQAGYEAHYPNCDFMMADINADGVVSYADINPFVALLSGAN